MTDNPYLTHLDEKGVARMVDVGQKPDVEITFERKRLGRDSPIPAHFQPHSTLT